MDGEGPCLHNQINGIVVVLRHLMAADEGINNQHIDAL